MPTVIHVQHHTMGTDVTSIATPAAVASPPLPQATWFVTAPQNGRKGSLIANIPKDPFVKIEKLK